ncbi:DUF4834 family protein [bacterium]|nr:DUF4834 family protein [bacterium]
MVGFVRTIFFIAIFYYLFRFIGRYLLPRLLASKLKNMQGQQQQRDQRFSENQKQQEGKVTVKTTSKKQDSIPKDKGEYVDFEEVD